VSKFRTFYLQEKLRDKLVKYPNEFFKFNLGLNGWYTFCGGECSETCTISVWNKKIRKRKKYNNNDNNNKLTDRSVMTTDVIASVIKS